jgi:Tol biopolymer transport system component
MYWGVATAAALIGVFVVTIFEGAAQSQTASQGLFARSSVPAGAATLKIAFIREPLNAGYGGVLWVMNADGSGQRRLVPAPYGARWSPDGQKIAFVAGESDVYVMNADGSGQQRLTSHPGWDGGWDDGGLAWSPDGRSLAFNRQLPPDGRSSEIYVMNADGSEQRMLTRIAAQLGDSVDLAWSPLGNKIAFVSRRDGSLELYVMNPDGSGQRRLTRNTVRDSNPVWSPDGRRIAFDSNWQVWVMNADGSGQRRLTRNGARNVAPAWSPDGQRIAFERRLGRVQSTSWCSGCGTAKSFEVWVMNADGSGQERLTPRGSDPRAGLDDQDRKPAWSRDGRRIAFVSKRDGNNEIYVMKADGSGQQNLTRTRGWHERWLAWSPDG